MHWHDSDTNGSGNREAKAVITAYRFGQFRSKDRRVELLDREVISLHLAADSGASRDVLKCDFSFVWRDLSVRKKVLVRQEKSPCLVLSFRLVPPEKSPCLVLSRP